MNKRAPAFVSERQKELEARLERQNHKDQSSYSVDAGRDVQTNLTAWQRSALGNVEQFATKQGFRRHHPYRLLNQFAANQRNANPRQRWEEFINAENERIQLPETVKKANNVYAANQMGLVQTALDNFVKSKEKLNSVVPVGV